MEPGHKHLFFPALPCAASGALLSGVPRILAQAPLPPLCVALPVLQTTALASCITQVPQSPALIRTDLPFLIQKARVLGGCCRKSVLYTHIHGCCFPGSTPSVFWVGVLLRVRPCSPGRTSGIYVARVVLTLLFGGCLGKRATHCPVLGRAGDGPQQGWGLALPQDCQSGGP